MARNSGLVIGSPVGLQQLLRAQGFEWGDSGRGGSDYHLWLDGGTLYTDAFFSLGQQLTISSTQAAVTALRINGFENNGAVSDSVDIIHRATGDGIFVAHMGGTPSGGGPVPGADAGLNVLIPYNIDDYSTGRAGSVVNTNTGMVGLLVDSQATSSSAAVKIGYSGPDWGVQVTNNDVAYPQGNGNMFLWRNYGTGHMAIVQHHASTASVTLQATSYDDASGVRHFANLILDGEANQRFQVTYAGTLGWGQNGTAAPDAFLQYGTSAKQLTMKNELKIQQGSGLSGSRTFSIFTTGDAAIGFQILGTGLMQWSDRTAAFDTNLYRAGVGSLKTDTQLTVGGLLQTVLSATGGAGLNLPHGAAPTSPVNGDLWTTSSGLFVRINGVTKTVTLT